MPARYLIRLDDACPTMKKNKWSRIESILDRFDIKPIVAVVPDNQDPELKVNVPDSGFWDLAQRWQAKGWTIALHGYQHAFHSVSRKKLILPFYDRSEFAGLAYDFQAQKLDKAWSICDKHHIHPTVWVAPAHCFDHITLQALKDTTPIRIISDGIACDQFFQNGFFWLPQQLWQFMPKRSGLWTICLHPNSMQEQAFSELEALLADPKYAASFARVVDIQLAERKPSMIDISYREYFWSRSNLVAKLARLKRNFTT